MHFSTLSEWISWIESIHISEIELGLDRVKTVAERLNVLLPSCSVITIGGTNGKGSTVAGLESIYRSAGYRVGAFTSPILFKHNEQVRVDGQQASDEEFCTAFDAIETARIDISLTPFEFFTLAALLIFKKHPLDVMLLEVGLGGRLDAVNIIDANAAVVASIDIDHVDWLGPTREDIAREKAGIFRKDRPAVYGDVNLPNSLMEHALNIGAPLFCQGRDFHYQENPVSWSWSYQDKRHDDLPLSALATQNMSVVLMTVTVLHDRLPIKREAIDKGLSEVTLPGRIQVINGSVMEIYDVSHNPAAVRWLAKRLKEITCYGKTHAVFSMLKDKDIAESVKVIRDVIDAWYVAPLPVKRAASPDVLLKAFHQADISSVTLFSSIEEAYNIAKLKSQLGDRIVVFGSFHTVAQVLSLKCIPRCPRLVEGPRDISNMN